ncbi:MAG TPA: hypothetical protein VGO62_08255 [Myxococcota bacterium]
MTLHVLIDIRDGIGRLETRMERVEGAIGQTNARIDQTNARFDNLIETIGGDSKHQRERIDRLEDRVGKLERGTRRRPTTPPRRR